MRPARELVLLAESRKSSKKQQELADLPQIQKKILDTASRYVKKEGILVYSTCTLLREENDQVIEAFLSQHTEFEPCPLPQEVREAAKLTDPAASTVTAAMIRTNRLHYSRRWRIQMDSLFRV